MSKGALLPLAAATLTILALAALAAVIFVERPSRDASDEASPPAAARTPTSTVPQPSPRPTQSLQPRLDRVREEFLAHAARIRASSNPYFGDAYLERLRVKVEALDDLAPAVAFDTQANLCLELLRIGEVGEAVALVEKLQQWVKEHELAHPNYVNLLSAIAYLRQSEVENCIRRHNKDCCLFPLSGGGLHTEAGPARKARAALEAYLAVNPRDIDAAWLLNVTAMATNDWPAGVPEEHLIPPSSLDSEIEFPRFTDIAPRVGVDVFGLSGGAVVCDFNGDELLDIVLSSMDPEASMTFMVNDGTGQFENRTTGSGLEVQLGGLNCVAADYDSDGDTDLLVLRGAWFNELGCVRKSLLQNQGNGTFLDVTEAAGMAAAAYPTQAAAWADFDGDGDLDAYVGAESGRGLGDPSAPNYPSQLYSNNGDGTFTDVAVAAGVTNDLYCKGVAVGDHDNDGDIDLFVANFGRNRLYANNGDGTFTDVADELGVTGTGPNSFACWFFDYDNDGWLDLFFSTFRASLADHARYYRDGIKKAGMTPQLFRNTGGTFHEVTAEAGMDRVCLPMGSSFGDLDNDGWLDVYLATGAPDFQMLVPNLMLRNDAGKRFQDITREGGFGHLQKGHSVSFADVDNDGDQDVHVLMGGFFPGDGFANALFLNPGVGVGRHLTLDLVGTRSSRQPIGARLTLVLDTAAGERRLHRAVGSVSSFGSTPRRQEIGLGNATAIVRLEIHWPSGAKEIHEALPLDSFLRITEGAPRFERIQPPAVSFD